MSLAKLHVYSKSKESDLLLLQWWARLDAGPDMALTFHTSAQSPSSFLGFFQPPRRLFFAFDDAGIWFAVWFEPVLSGAFCGLWVAQHKRKSREALEFFDFALDTALKVWPVIMGLTKQPKLLAPHRRMGYTVLGEIPYLFDGENAWILTLTRGGFEDGRRRRRRRKSPEHATAESRA